MLDRINTSRYDRGRAQAQRSAREKIKLIIENKMKFKITDQDYIKTVRDFKNQKEPYTENQLSYIDALMEKYWKFGGFGSVGTKHDIQKTLRY